MVLQWGAGVHVDELISLKLLSVSLQSWKERERAEHKIIFKLNNAEIYPHPSLVSLLLRRVAFLAPAVDREDGFSKPIWEEMPLLVRHLPEVGGKKNNLLAHTEAGTVN